MNRTPGLSSWPSVRLLTLAAVIAVPASAQMVYSWEDADGLHYTDDPAQVPKQQRKVEATQVDARPSQQQVATAPSPQPSRVEAAPQNERERRERFIGANRRISTLRQELSALQVSLPPRTECIAQPVNTVPGTQVITANGVTVVNQPRPLALCQVNALHDAIRVQLGQKEVELRNAELDLEQLDRQASFESVPREWRRGW
jgi:hypothetical protein